MKDDIRSEIQFALNQIIVLRARIRECEQGDQNIDFFWSEVEFWKDEIHRLRLELIDAEG